MNFRVKKITTSEVFFLVVRERDLSKQENAFFIYLMK